MRFPEEDVCMAKVFNGVKPPSKWAGPSAHVRFWHLADIDADDEYVCFWG
jgi:hypothetical protein